MRQGSSPLQTGGGAGPPAPVDPPCCCHPPTLNPKPFLSPCSGLITPGGFSSVPAGMETPELIELRKKKIEEAMDG